MVKPKDSTDLARRLPPLGPRTAVAIFLALIVAAVGLQRFTSDSRNSSNPVDLTVIDGDTVRSAGITYRLVGFDAPERGDRALCDRERELAETVAARLQSLIAGGEPRLERIACPCKPGTEGTSSCNEGRSCAFLKIGGNDVGDTLIRESLAQPFVCGATSCPPRRPWC